MDLINSSQQY